MVPVAWIANEAGMNPRGYWDQGLLDETFNGLQWTAAGWPQYGHYVWDPDKASPGQSDRGAIVVLHVSQHHGDPALVQECIRRLGWALLIVTGDEEYRFDHNRLDHPNLRVWRQLPHPRAVLDNQLLGLQHGRFLGIGWPTATPDYLRAVNPTLREQKPVGWFFAGQVTHARRQQLAAVLAELPGGAFLPTPGFTLGYERDQYLWMMAQARVVPCPSGPTSVDTFRLWEALEAGAVPVADTLIPGDSESHAGYWNLAAPEAPFPEVADWAEFPEHRDRILATWPVEHNLCQSWFQLHKRQLGVDLVAEVERLQGGSSGHDRIHDDITVIVTTSPILRHPDTTTIEETLWTIRQQLRTSEVLIAADGVRPEQSSIAPAYNEYLTRLLRITRDEPNMATWIAPGFLHQANLVRLLLHEVHTPYVLLVEHDTPLTPDNTIDWYGLLRVLDSGELNVVRFYHEKVMQDEHWHLMLDRGPVDFGGVAMFRTRQWSQRPHLARTSYYRALLADYFRPEGRTMIEDTMHGVVANGDWDEHRIAIYSGPKTLERSYHLDGRGTAPKYEMRP